MVCKKYYTAVAFSASLDKSPNGMHEAFYEGKSIVLVRSANGTIAAYLNHCPHRGAPLSEGRLRNNQIECPYHGWTFDCQTGVNTHVPVKNSGTSCTLHTFFVEEKYAMIWVCTEKNACIPALKTQRANLTFHGSIQARLINVLENFLEGSHTHFVHDGLVRTEAGKRQELSGNFIPKETGFEVHYEAEKSKGWSTRLLPSKFRTLTPVATFIYPYTARLSYYNQRQEEVAAFETVLNSHEDSTQYFANVYLNLGWLTLFLKPFARMMFQKIISQDKKILELQETNLKRFPDAPFFSDETDLVGTQLQAWHFKQERILTSPHTFRIFW